MGGCCSLHLGILDAAPSTAVPGADHWAPRCCRASSTPPPARAANKRHQVQTKCPQERTLKQATMFTAETPGMLAPQWLEKKTVRRRYAAHGRAPAAGFASLLPPSCRNLKPRQHSSPAAPHGARSGGWKSVPPTTQIRGTSSPWRTKQPVPGGSMVAGGPTASGRPSAQVRGCCWCSGRPLDRFRSPQIGPEHGRHTVCIAAHARLRGAGMPPGSGATP